MRAWEEFVSVLNTRLYKNQQKMNKQISVINEISNPPKVIYLPVYLPVFPLPFTFLSLSLPLSLFLLHSLTLVFSPFDRSHHCSSFFFFHPAPSWPPPVDYGKQHRPDVYGRGTRDAQGTQSRIWYNLIAVPVETPSHRESSTSS